MIEYGRFGLLGLTDKGPNFVKRTRLFGEIAGAANEAKRVERIIETKKDAGKDATAETERLGMLRVEALTKSFDMVFACLVTLDGEAVDLDNDDDMARVGKALDRLTEEEWTALLEAIQGGTKSGG